MRLSLLVIVACGLTAGCVTHQNGSSQIAYDLAREHWVGEQDWAKYQELAKNLTVGLPALDLSPVITTLRTTNQYSCFSVHLLNFEALRTHGSTYLTYALALGQDRRALFLETDHDVQAFISKTFFTRRSTADLIGCATLFSELRGYRIVAPIPGAMDIPEVELLKTRISVTDWGCEVEEIPDGLVLRATVQTVPERGRYDRYHFLLATDGRFTATRKRNVRSGLGLDAATLDYWRQTEHPLYREYSGRGGVAVPIGVSP